MSATPSLHTRLRSTEPLIGAWVQAADAAVVASVAAAGFDYVVLDLQHGTGVESDVAGLSGIVAATGAAAVVRCRSGDYPDIGRPLDLGAAGVIIPCLRGEAEVRRAVAACRYPPAGDRSRGQLVTPAGDAACIVMVETAEALAALPAILSIEGIDAIYVGPSDLSAALGLRNDLGAPEFEATLRRIVDDCLAAGIPVGIHATDVATAQVFLAWGCRLVTVFADVPAVNREVARSLVEVRASLACTGG